MAERLDLGKIHRAGGYSSEFDEYDSEQDHDAETEKKRSIKDDELYRKSRPSTSREVPSKRTVAAMYDKEETQNRMYHFRAMDAYGRHKELINNYLLYYGGKKEDFKRSTANDKTDLDIIRENHRFLWNDEEEEMDTWEKRMAKKYYDKLYKEYCIADLSRYKENKVALRWRIEKEVIEGKGQFSCGNKKCSETEGLKSWEVNFGYMEQGEKKNALIKLRLCPDCSYKLNYHHKRKEAKSHKKRSEGNVSKRRKHDQEDSDRRKEDKDKTASPEAEKASSTTPTNSQSAEEVWKGPVQIVEEKSREEEFDDYFEDMFL
ncbi:PREDICTED: protein FRA10AC1 homolog [Branchiostoma belcheri]|uniref:Protein FRA10AC1 homolog n=1 Tax=Branchiostoma belcheri TaxID=7741 RepID=A0A6P4ZT05_BRABE|nr:PREDICTED: protein FRA10AC1 homolog [Branchiostoma belcheri]XP_019644290.1 PREDICTED: protein FRA10AC1 homolog [Branchiostoma belcheri]